MREQATDGELPLALLQKQRSHVLFALSNASPESDADFLDWYQGSYTEIVSRISGVLGVHHYQQHEVDITQGRYDPLPFHYLGLYELAVDGAEAADEVIERITTLHLEQASAETPATWLYYPVSDKVGRSANGESSMLTLAFANALPGQEVEFREWYATRHIRHALNIPALVSGQCFERTKYQRPGAMEPPFSTIAVYEQEGPPESIIESFASLPPGTLDFPMLDLSRFAEHVYETL